VPSHPQERTLGVAKHFTYAYDGMLNGQGGWQKGGKPDTREGEKGVVANDRLNPGEKGGTKQIDHLKGKWQD